MKRKITSAETSEILSLKRSDINMPLLRGLFATKRGQNGPRFNTYDTMDLPRNKLYNSAQISTTVGRYIFNMFVIPEKYLKKSGYQNLVFDSDNLGKFEKEIAGMFLEDELTSLEYTEFLDNGEWITLGMSYFLVPTIDSGMNSPIAKVIKRRDELFKEYEKEIKAGDPNISSRIENELLDLAKAELEAGGNEGYDFYKSGEFNFGNNYKKTSIMAGAVENPYTKKLDILKSNYVDGITKEDFPYLANITIIGGYSRNVETQKGGYETKKINNSTQVIVLDAPGTDCGTAHTLKTFIPDKMKSMFINRYVSDKGKLTLITTDNVSQYVGKEVNLRSPMFCKTEEICSKCAGELYHKMGIKNAGLLTSTMSGSLMNLAMKKFHDTSIKFNKIDINNFVKESK
jgi:hypothetical protein